MNECKNSYHVIVDCCNGDCMASFAKDYFFPDLKSAFNFYYSIIGSYVLCHDVYTKYYWMIDNIRDEDAYKEDEAFGIITQISIIQSNKSVIFDKSFSCWEDIYSYGIWIQEFEMSYDDDAFDGFGLVDLYQFLGGIVLLQHEFDIRIWDKGAKYCYNEDSISNQTNICSYWGELRLIMSKSEKDMSDFDNKIQRLKQIMKNANKHSFDY